MLYMLQWLLKLGWKWYNKHIHSQINTHRSYWCMQRRQPHRMPKALPEKCFRSPVIYSKTASLFPGQSVKPGIISSANWLLTFRRRSLKACVHFASCYVFHSWSANRKNTLTTNGKKWEPSATTADIVITRRSCKLPSAAMSDVRKQKRRRVSVCLIDVWTSAA